MRLEVQYLAQLRQAAGVARETVDVPADTSVADLLALLAERHGPDFRRLLLDAQGRLHPAILLFIGGEQVPGDSTRVFGADEVLTLLAPMAGGEPCRPDRV